MSALSGPGLVIHSHPVADSLSGALFAAAVEGLTTPAGEPPATASLNSGDHPTSADLRAVTTLVFVYPTWWGGPPAKLQDWIERELGPWIDGPSTGPSPISTVERLVAITSHGSPALLNRATGEPGRKLFKRSIKPLASPSCTWHWLSYYGIDADNTATRTAFVNGIPDKLRQITSG